MIPDFLLRLLWLRYHVPCQTSRKLVPGIEREAHAWSFSCSDPAFALIGCDDPKDSAAACAALHPVVFKNLIVCVRCLRVDSRMSKELCGCGDLVIFEHLGIFTHASRKCVSEFLTYHAKYRSNWISQQSSEADLRGAPWATYKLCHPSVNVYSAIFRIISNIINIAHRQLSFTVREKLDAWG